MPAVSGVLYGQVTKQEKEKYMFQLPIVVDACITSECWTYIKTCILESSAEGRQWMAAHMNVFFDGKNVFFGENFKFYPAEYYNTALNFRPTDINEISSSNLVSSIRSTLNNGEYVVLYCNISRIFAVCDKAVDIHEIMIFGYDDEKQVFFSSLLDNSIGRPKILNIPYQHLTDAYNDMKAYIIENREDAFWKTYSYYYPYTSIKAQVKEQPPFNLLTQCLSKLEYEFYSDEWLQAVVKDNDTGRFLQGHTGVGCLKGILSVISLFLDGRERRDNSSINLTLSLLRLYEHRENMLRTLKLLDQLTEYSISSDQDPNEKPLEVYEDCCRRMKGCYMLSRKWDITGKKPLLEKIAAECEDLYTIEKGRLGYAYKLGKDYIKEGL